MAALGTIAGLCAAVAAALATVPAAAQVFPARPVKIVVPYTAGGPADSLARLVGQKLSDKWGQPVVIENKPGANTIIGMEYVARSAPDGYTLILATTAMTINAAIVPKLPFDTAKDFTPVCNLISTSFLLAVHPSIPVKNLDELIAHAKKNPGKLSFGSGGNGSPTHFSGDLLQSMGGVKLVHVPYKGTATAMTDLVAGHINMLFGDPMALWPYVTESKIRAIGVSSLKRYSAAPDVPTLSESGLQGFESGVWYGLVGPAGMPQAIVDSINATARQVMRDPEMEKRFTAFGSSVVANSPADFQAQIQADLAKWKAAAASNPILKD